MVVAKLGMVTERQIQDIVVPNRFVEPRVGRVGLPLFHGAQLPRTLMASSGGRSAGT